MRSAGLGRVIALCDLLIILEADPLCFYFETLSILSIFWRVVFVVFLECLPERVLERSRV